MAQRTDPEAPSPPQAPLWAGGPPLVLASTSPTRRALLAAAGIPAEAQASGIDERAVEAAEGTAAPADLALRLAREKALAVSRARPERLVLGADQVLDLEGTVLHKPADRAAAHAQLRRLCGRSHSLHSACALAREGAILEAFVASARLTMRPLEDEALARYLDAVGEAALAGAGSYQVEGLGIHLFAAIDGDHATILGLPLIPLLARLRALGCLVL